MSKHSNCFFKQSSKRRFCLLPQLRQRNYLFFNEVSLPQKILRILLISAVELKGKKSKPVFLCRLCRCFFASITGLLRYSLDTFLLQSLFSYFIVVSKFKFATLKTPVILITNVWVVSIGRICAHPNMYNKCCKCDKYSKVFCKMRASYCWVFGCKAQKHFC